MEKLQARIIEQHQEGFFLDEPPVLSDLIKADHEWIEGWDNSVLDAEVHAEWCDDTSTRIDNEWLEPSEGYIRLMLGDVVMLRITGCDAVWLAGDFDHKNASDFLTIPEGKIRAYIDNCWHLDSLNVNIAISDNMAEQLGDRMNYLVEKMPYEIKM